MCSSCVAEDTYDRLSNLRDEISSLDAKAAGLTKEELVKEIENLAEAMWD